MRRGALRNVIQIQEDAGTEYDGMNTRIPDWNLWREVFCEKTSRRGREHFDANTKQRYSETVHHFRCRYSDVDGISTENRILHEGSIYNIRSILPDDQMRDEVLIEATFQEVQFDPPTLPEETPPAWLLGSGFWNDDAAWDDDAVWNDGA